MYYSTFPIQEQAKKGDWDYQLAAVYTIGILDFVFDDDRHKEQISKITGKSIEEVKKAIDEAER